MKKNKLFTANEAILAKSGKNQYVLVFGGVYMVPENVPLNPTIKWIV